MFISKGKVKGKHFLSQILAVNQHLKRKQYNFEIEVANMAEIPKQNKQKIQNCHDFCPFSADHSYPILKSIFIFSSIR